MTEFNEDKIETNRHRKESTRRTDSTAYSPTNTYGVQPKEMRLTGTAANTIGQAYDYVASQGLGGESRYDISPGEAVEKYLEDNQNWVYSTKRSYENQLSWFVKWCRKEPIESMRGLDGNHLSRFKGWRQSEGNKVDGMLSMSTLKGDLSTLANFLKWCWRREYVSSELHRKIELPETEQSDGLAEVEVSSSEATAVTEYFERFDYAELEHLVWVLLTETGARPVGLQALDVDDLMREGAKGYLTFRNRPDEDTRLKNGDNSERNVTISSKCCDVLDAWIDRKRPDVTDEFDREPLLATPRGRISRTTIRRYCNQLTRTCVTQSGCPHGRSPDDCEALSKDTAPQCPSSKPPSAVRSGYISHYLKLGVPVKTIAERCDVSPRVLRCHYDVRSEEEKRKQREGQFFGHSSGRGSVEQTGEPMNQPKWDEQDIGFFEHHYGQ